MLWFKMLGELGLPNFSLFSIFSIFSDKFERQIVG